MRKFSVWKNSLKAKLQMQEPPNTKQCSNNLQLKPIPSAHPQFEEGTEMTVLVTLL